MISIRMPSCIAALSLAAAPSLAGTQAGEQQATTDAAAIVRSMLEHIGQSDSITVDTASMQSVTMQGQTQRSEFLASIRAERPNHLYATLNAEGELQHAIASDGESLWQYLGFFNAFSVDDAIEGFGEALDVMAFGEPMTLETALFVPHAMALMMFDEGVGFADRLNLQGAEYVERIVMDGRDYHHVKVAAQEQPFDLWIDAGEKPTLARLEPDLSAQLEQMRATVPAEMGEIDRSIAIIFDNWSFDTSFEEGAFTFEPPEGAKEVDSLLEEINKEMGGPPESDLVGKAAPEVTLKLLEGGTLEIPAEGEGDGEPPVLVLDFWATWCAPCVRGLPIVTSVCAKFEEQGVRFIGVNEGEDEEKIRAFFKRLDMTFEVAMDQDGKIGEDYGVTGIPQTVIIDREGVVQAVHIGLLPDLETVLTDELERVLKGEDLFEAEDTDEADEAAADEAATDEAGDEQAGP